MNALILAGLLLAGGSFAAGMTVGDVVADLVARERDEPIDEILADLDKNFPGLKERICDESGNVRRFVNIFLNDEDIRFLDEKATVVKDGDEISIVPAIAGG